MTITMRSTTALLLTALAMAVYAAAATAYAGEKVTLCHITSSATNRVMLLEVSEHSVDAHLAHGDTLFNPETGCDEGGGGGGPN